MRAKAKPPQSRGEHPTLKPARSALVALPNELWTETLSYLSKRELKDVRLVGDRHLNTMASSQLFTTTYIAARRGVLNTFKYMTSHSTIRHFIKEVVYDYSWFDPPDGTSRMRDGTYRITASCSDLPLANVFQEQERIQSKELSQCLKSAFTMLTHVRRVVFADLSRTTGLPGDVVDREGKLLAYRIHSGFWTTNTGQCCLKESNSQICPSHHGVFRRQFGGFIPLLRELSASAPPTFDELVLGDGVLSSDNINYANPSTRLGSSYGGIPNWFFATISVCLIDEPHLHFPIFRQLRKLDLTICFPGHPKDRNSDLCPAPAWPSLGMLGLVLSAMNSLEDLRLCGQIDTGNVKFSETVGCKKPGKLRKLELRYFEATFKELASSFLLHRDSLQCVKLDFFNLREGSWHKLDQIFSKEMPDLRVTAGWVWQDGSFFDYNEAEDNHLWIPRKREDRLFDDKDKDFEDFDDRESSCDEDRDHSDGSEEWDTEEENLFGW